jgi:hypothetical protein
MLLKDNESRYLQLFGDPSRLPLCLYVVEQPAQLLHLTQPVDLLLESLIVILGHGRNVAASAKRSTGAGDYDAAYVGVSTPTAQSFDGPGDQIHAERIELIWPVKREGRYSIGNVGEYYFVSHVVLSKTLNDWSEIISKRRFVASSSESSL